MEATIKTMEERFADLIDFYFATRDWSTPEQKYRLNQQIAQVKKDLDTLYFTSMQG